MKPIVFTVHARHALGEREIDEAMAVATVTEPEWTEADRWHKERARAFRRFEALGGRALRVVYEEGPEAIVIVTVFEDDRARRKE